MPKSTIIEAKVLTNLQKGSYEEMMTQLDQAVTEAEELLGEGTVLLATYPDRVVVVNEAAEFFTVGYTVGDGGIVNFDSPERMDVEVISEEDVVADGVQKFLEGGSIAESLKGLVGMTGDTTGSVLDEMRNRVRILFSRGGVWRKGLQRNEQAMGTFAWDADYGSLEIDTDPVFEHLYADEEAVELEEHREAVRNGLIGLEGRLVKMLQQAKAAWVKYQQDVDLTRDEEADSTLVQFEAFSDDYISHLADVGAAVSEAVQDSGEGCVQCGALVHDEVIRRMKELELGGRFVRKVSVSFAQ